MSWLDILGCDRRTGKPLIDLDHARQSIADILFTPRGSRLANRAYGSDLPDLIDQPLNEAGIQRVYAATAIALSEHYPQFRLQQIELSSDNPGHLTIHLTGALAGQDEPVTLSISYQTPASLLAA